MAVFRHPLWGYELTYPDDWVHQPAQDADAFAPGVEQQSGGDGVEDTGQLLVRGEWNATRQPIEPLWNQHIGLLASMMGARQVGSAPWRIGEAVGLEAEIVLPKKDNRRLWTGILMQDFRVLHFMAMHPREARPWFEPAATKIITSLQFPRQLSRVETSPEGLPLPPGYAAVDPKSILADIADSRPWYAYAGKESVGALQAFYLRELPVYNWEIVEYSPFPGPPGPGFARLRLRGGNLRITLGLMPYTTSETVSSSSPANIVFKIA